MSKASTEKERIIAAMRAALRFYANNVNWEPIILWVNGQTKVTPPRVVADRGRMARVALLSTLGKRMEEYLTGLAAEHHAVKVYLESLDSAPHGGEEEEGAAALAQLRKIHQRANELGQMG